MRIRSIKPEFWRSERISGLDWETRLLFIGLWSYVDDNGVGLDRVSLITADLFADDLANDSRDTFARVSRGLQTLSDAGRIIRYAVDGKSYLYIVNWLEHQKIDKPGKARYPQPEEAVTSTNPTENSGFSTVSRHSREIPAPGTGEQGNRGTGEEAAAEVSYLTTDRKREISTTPAAAAPPGNGNLNNPRCPKHFNVPAEDRGPNCRNCRRHREWLQAEADPATQAAATQAAKRAELRELAAVKAQAIADCAMCDENGYHGTRVCDHDPERAAKASRGSALARAALAKKLEATGGDAA